jgi:hypothetical protein
MQFVLEPLLLAVVENRYILLLVAADGLVPVVVTQKNVILLHLVRHHLLLWLEDKVKIQPYLAMQRQSIPQVGLLHRRQEVHPVVIGTVEVDVLDSFVMIVMVAPIVI